MSKASFSLKRQEVWGDAVLTRAVVWLPHPMSVAWGCDYRFCSFAAYLATESPSKLRPVWRKVHKKLFKRKSYQVNTHTHIHTVTHTLAHSKEQKVIQLAWGWGLRFCISNKFPGKAAASGMTRMGRWSNLDGIWRLGGGKIEAENPKVNVLKIQAKKKKKEISSIKIPTMEEWEVLSKNDILR